MQYNDDFELMFLKNKEEGGYIVYARRTGVKNRAYDPVGRVWKMGISVWRGKGSFQGARFGIKYSGSRFHAGLALAYMFNGARESFG